MSVQYRPVTWNRNKWVYDALLVLFVILYIFFFIRLAPDLLDFKNGNASIVRMRAFGTCAFLMLTFILCIGPLARMDKRFLPLLYNRRHFGVLTFAVAFSHYMHVEGWYFAFSPRYDALQGVLAANTAYDSWAGFPFEAFGIVALLTLFAMAATSHDFWLSFLTPPIWKRLHMLVYVAYGALILHLAFGLLQTEAHPFYVIMTGGSFGLVACLHIAAGLREARIDGGGENGISDAARAGFVTIGDPYSIGDNRGKTVTLPDGERVAVFRYDGKVSAISNVCAHQNGPLGEGRVVDGCVTCPWHGFQYRPEDGCSPAPFTEKVATYRLHLENGVLMLDPAALPPGTPVEPIQLEVQQ